MKIHHIGYLVDDMSKAIDNFKQLGYIPQQIIYDDDRDIDICFVDNAPLLVELVCPRESCDLFLALKNKIVNSPYHICYISDNFENDINRLEQHGWLVLTPPQRAIAIKKGATVTFLFNKYVGIIELVKF